MTNLLILSASLALSISLLISAATRSTFCFCCVFSVADNVASLSIASLTIAAWSLISFLPASFKPSKPLLFGLCSASSFGLPSVTNLLILSASGALSSSLISVIISAATRSTSCFCWFFSAVVKVTSLSIASLTIAACCLISSTASALCFSRLAPLWWTLLILSQPSSLASLIPFTVVAALMLLRASIRIVSTWSFCLFFSTEVRVLSKSIVALAISAALLTASLAGCFSFSISSYL